MADIVVIGAGLIGMLVARELAQAGASVTILERGEPGQESSWAGGGILSPLYPWRYPASVTALSLWSQQVYPGLAAALLAETGIDPEWTCSGLLLLDVEDLEKASQWAAHHAQPLSTLDRAELAALEPALVPHDSALWMPATAQIRNPRLLQALYGSVIQAGVRVQTQVEVAGILTAGGAVTGVQTRRGRLPAGKVVIAGGAWSADLLAPLGVSLELVPVRGQMLLFHASPGQVQHILLSDDHYLIPRRDGRVLAGSTVEYVGFDKSTTADARQLLCNMAYALIPALASCDIERHWAGLRPGIPSNIPIISEHPAIPGLFVNTGHFRNGVVTAPASARLLADLILGRAPILAPDPYQLKPSG